MNAAENMMELHLGERLYRLMEHDLPAAEEAEARAHLESCVPCAAEHEKLKRTLSVLKSVGRVTAPSGFAAQVLRRARVNGPRGRPLGGLLANKVPFEGGIIILVAAAVAAAVIAWQTTGARRMVTGAAEVEHRAE